MQVEQLIIVHMMMIIVHIVHVEQLIIVHMKICLSIHQELSHKFVRCSSVFTINGYQFKLSEHDCTYAWM